MTTPSRTQTTATGEVPPDQAIERASGGQANADKAADDVPDQPEPTEDAKLRLDALLDEALEETFPASDPIAPQRII